jgi:DNA mismatch endonuclease, patch repair protein
MRAIKGKNTSPELLVRKIARTISTGYRLHRKDISGKPDLAWVGPWLQTRRTYAKGKP